MKRLLFISILILFTGCASKHRISTVNEINYIPGNDCRNLNFYISRLERDLQVPKDFVQPQDNYDQVTYAINHKIWHLRHVCNPA